MSYSVEDLIMDELELEERLLILKNLKEEIAERDITKSKRESALNQRNKDKKEAAEKLAVEVRAFIRTCKFEGLNTDQTQYEVEEKFSIGRSRFFEIKKGM